MAPYGNRRPPRREGRSSSPPLHPLNDPPGQASHPSDRMPSPVDPAGAAPDAELIARWKGGDERAATLLVERHAPALARYVASLGVRGELDEVVQDTFVRA